MLVMVLTQVEVARGEISKLEEGSENILSIYSQGKKQGLQSDIMMHN